MKVYVRLEFNAIVDLDDDTIRSLNGYVRDIASGRNISYSYDGTELVGEQDRITPVSFDRGVVALCHDWLAKVAETT